MCLLMLMMVEDGPRADGLQIVSGNYYHWWIMNKYYYYYSYSWGDVSSSLLPVCTIPSPIPSLDGWGGWRWRDGGAFDDGRGWWMIIATARGGTGRYP